MRSLRYSLAAGYVRRYARRRYLSSLPDLNRLGLGLGLGLGTYIDIGHWHCWRHFVYVVGRYFYYLTMATVASTLILVPFFLFRFLVHLSIIIVSLIVFVLEGDCIRMIINSLRSHYLLAVRVP